MASFVYVLLSLASIARALPIRFLPQFLSFMPVVPPYPSALGSGYLSVPITADLLQQTTQVDDYSISLWYKSNSNPPNSVPIFQIANATWGAECCNLYDANSALYFKTSTSLVFGLDFYNYMGLKYTAQTSQTVAASDLNWHFVGVSRCKSQKVVRLCRDAVCTEAAYKADIPMTLTMMMYIGGYPTDFSGGFSGRIGDVVLYTNTCHSPTDFTSIKAAKPTIPNCTPIPAFGGAFYDACQEYAQPVSVKFLSTGTTLAPSFTPDASTVVVGYAGTFYGRTLTFSVGMAAWMGVTASISFTRSGGTQTVTLSVVAGQLTLTWNLVDTPPSAVACASPLKSFVYAEVELNNQAGGPYAMIKCDGTASAAVVAPTLGGVTNAVDSFTFKGSVYDVKIKPLSTFSFAWDTGLDIGTVMASQVDTMCGKDSSNAPSCTCAPGYYFSNARCWQCHPACQQCTGPGYDACTACSASYYRQPTSSSLCLSQCPTGYTASGSSCVLSANPLLSISFDNDLAGDITLPSGQHIQMGFESSKFYPEFDFLDPFPVQYRGMFYNISESIDLPSKWGQVGSLVLGTDFSVDMWILPYSYGSLFRVNTNNGWQDDDLLNFGITQYLEWPPTHYNYYLSLGLKTKGQAFDFQITELKVVSFKTEWLHVAFSATYDPILKVTNAVVFLNSQSYTLTFQSYFEDFPTSSHNVGFLGGYFPGYLGFVYSMSIVNLPRTFSDFVALRGNCAGCVCPASVGKCLPTCGPWQYVDSAGACQSCQKQCKYGCTRPTSCNLCEDDLCYKCRTFDAGTCTECIPGAVFVNSRCTCPAGTFVSNGQCRNECDSGYYFSTKTSKCEACQRGCLKCNETTCFLCRSEFYLDSGVCSCGVGWYITESYTCAKCNAICKRCMDDKAKCTECYTEEGYVQLENTCVDCRTISGYSGGQGKTGVLVAGLTQAQAINAVCQEICGDGLVKGQLECDDGNLASGDGCSNQCQIEHGWTCSSPTAGGKSVCVDNTAPTPLLSYVKQTQDGYELVYSFSETVIIGETLDTLADVTIDSGSIFTYSFDRSLTNSDLYSPFTLSISASQSFPADSVLTVTITDVDKVTDASGNKLSPASVETTLKDAYTLASTQAVTTAMTGVSGGIAGIAGISAVTAILGGSSLSLLWGLIEILQIVNYLVFMSVEFPDNLRHFLRALNFANFEFIPNFFDMYMSDEFNAPPKPFVVEDVGTDLLINIGNMVTVWAVLLLLFVVALVLTRIFPRVGVFARMHGQYQYSTVLRTGTESFLQLALAVFLQMRSPVPHSTFGYFSLLACAAVFVYLALSYVITILKVTRVKPAELRDKEYKKRFGTLYKDYHLTAIPTRSFLLLVNARRTLFVLALVCVVDSSIAQAILLPLLTVGFLVSLVVLWPYKSRWTGNILQIATEALFLLSQCFIAVLCSHELTTSARNGIGWIVIVLLSSMIVMHICVIAASQVKEIMKLVNKCNMFLLKGSVIDDEKKRRTQELPDVGKVWAEDEAHISPFEETKIGETEQSGSSSNILYPLVVEKFLGKKSDSGGSNSDSPDEEVEDKKPSFKPPKAIEP